MVALIIGDLVNSASMPSEKWMPVLKDFLNRQGRSPAAWEIFRGDSFQFRCAPEASFRQYLLLKSRMKQLAGLDVRVSIGIGAVEYEAAKITESNGPAFVRAGRTFDRMKGKQYLAFCTGNDTIDKTLNLMGRFASLIMDNWTVSAAETITAILENPDWNQQQVADRLDIGQSAVSQNRKRAQFDLIMEFNEYYITAVNSLKP